LHRADPSPRLHAKRMHPFDDVVELSSYMAGLAHGLARLREG
jgi:hypothetical protein